MKLLVQLGLMSLLGLTMASYAEYCPAPAHVQCMRGVNNLRCYSTLGSKWYGHIIKRDNNDTKVASFAYAKLFYNHHNQAVVYCYYVGNNNALIWLAPSHVGNFDVTDNKHWVEKTIKGRKELVCKQHC